MLAHVFLAGVVALTVLTAVAAFAAPDRARPAAVGIGVASLGLAGTALGVQVVRVDLVPVRLDWLLPLSGAQLGGDALSGTFVVVTGVVSISVGIFLAGYARGGHLGRFTLAVIPIFVTSMLLVPLAASVTTFLAAWELMALSSTMLVLSEHRRAACRHAGLVYAVMTHLGFLTILTALAVFAAGTHSELFTVMSQHAAALPPQTRDAVFLLTLAGFGSKAGLLPLHAWLPRAHPEAPGPVSALMSAAMVTLGIYGLLRVDVLGLRGGPPWWGLAVLIVGAVTAVYAALQSSVATDLKRLLAYSTSEHMGLAALGVGGSMLLSATGHRDVAALALTAAMLHLLTHAAFKTLAFLGAAAVQRATGIRDLDRLGGLAGSMPATTAMFGIAALGGSGLPLGATFLSEWLLLQSLVHDVPSSSAEVALATPLAVASIALCAGLGVAAMVKAFGVGFLARPRSPGAAQAREAPRPMVAGMAFAAAASVALAVTPSVTGPLFTRLATTIPGLSTGVRWGALVRLPGYPGSVSPAWLMISVAGLAVTIAATMRLTVRRRVAPAAVPLWACGAGPLTPRMQYTATAFAEPLQRVFDDVLRPDTDIEVTHLAESQYLLDRIRYRGRITDAIEVRLYAPLLDVIAAGANVLRRAHNGRLHLYLAYGAAGLLLALVVAG